MQARAQRLLAGGGEMGVQEGISIAIEAGRAAAVAANEEHALAFDFGSIV